MVGFRCTFVFKLISFLPLSEFKFVLEYFHSLFLFYFPKKNDHFYKITQVFIEKRSYSYDIDTFLLFIIHLFNLRIKINYLKRISNLKFPSHWYFTFQIKAYFRMSKLAKELLHFHTCHTELI